MNETPIFISPGEATLRALAVGGEFSSEMLLEIAAIHEAISVDSNNFNEQYCWAWVVFRIAEDIERMER